MPFKAEDFASISQTSQTFQEWFFKLPVNMESKPFNKRETKTNCSGMKTFGQPLSKTKAPALQGYALWS